MGGAVSCCRAEAQETSQGSDTDGHPDPFGIADKRPQTTAGVERCSYESREPQPTETRGRGKVQCKRTERERIVDPRTERSGKNFIFKFYRALFRDNF